MLIEIMPHWDRPEKIAHAGCMKYWVKSAWLEQGRRRIVFTGRLGLRQPPSQRAAAPVGLVRFHGHSQRLRVAH